MTQAGGGEGERERERASERASEREKERAQCGRGGESVGHEMRE
jgi:hypothetical protein